VLVLAVAVLVFEHFRGVMGLVAADTEGDADVANLRGDVGVDGFDFIFFAALAGGDLGDLGFDFCVGHDAIVFQAAIPLANRIPALERCPGYVRKLAFLGLNLLVGGEDVLFLALVLGFRLFPDGGLELGGGPTENVLCTFDGFDGLVGGAPDIYVGIFGEAQFQGLG
jgi:hypothetical protein